MLKFAANISLMFTDAAFSQRFQRARDAGFKAVEFMFPYEHKASDIGAWLTENQLENVLFNAPPGNWNQGERGLAAIPGRENEFFDSIGLALEYSKPLKTPRVHIMAGITEGFDHDQCRETFENNLTRVAPIFADAGVDMLIEPINSFDMPGYFLTQIDEAVAIISRLALPNLKLQFDIYHRQMMGGDVISGLKQAGVHIGHIQIAGVPGRHEPNVGTLNYQPVFQYLHTSGYSGWIGCEYHPASNTETGLGWLQTLREQGMAE